mmetsp:Transcript_131758/g.409583  ORF Transcript_131758/g.409583 Transcript_131758/m.409583 type:complete len:305 (+) Transcript_131758:173-1087(+)
MGVPDDANPLNRRLPAEVVSRRRKVEKVEKKEPPLETDRAQVLAMKPEHRLKWLSKALQKCQEGKVPPNTVFDIATHARFTADATDKIGAKMFRIVRANLQLFSSKQQRYLESECQLVQMFKRTLRSGGDGADAPATAAAGSSADAEEPAAETAGIAALWARMTQLSPMERVEAVEQLDAGTKELLEDFLEARIRRAQGGAGSGGPSEPAADGAGSDARGARHGSASRSGSRSRSGGRRRSRSRSRAGEKGRRARERSRSRSEAAGGKRNKDREDAARRSRKGKSGRGRSSSGRRGRSSSSSPS